jgi:hypothetical protein
MGHPDCWLCARLDRATAYRYLGEPHFIPVSHGCRWLADDLRDVIGSLAPGEKIAIDYDGKVDDAPTVTFVKGDDLAIAATVTVPNVMHRDLLHVSLDGTTYPTLVFEVMGALRDARGARAVILVPPVGPISSS